MNPATGEAKVQVTADGAIVFDPACAGAERFEPEWFEPAYWRGRGLATDQGGGRGGVLRVRAGDAEWMLRHYHRGGMVARVLGDRYLWNGAERTRGFAEFHLLAELARRGLNVPVPVAARYRRNGVHYRADLITRYIAPAQTLAERLRAGAIDAATAARVGAGIAEFHAVGAYHADLNAHNVLLDARKVWLVDFDRGALRVPARSWQLANLARLRRSLLKLGAARDNEQAFDRECWQPLAEAYERALDHGATHAPAGRGGL
ncbi:MAG TPA: 3-deoxy-D-manno-octulosonic acid kinase [Rudaea sp.]|nr:3-deoxy-D-manno-octulosonic acid kinase [Rudaea sp.]